MWAGALHDPEFVRKVIKTVEELDEAVYPTKTRMLGMLTVVAEVPTPLFPGFPPAPHSMFSSSLPSSGSCVILMKGTSHPVLQNPLRALSPPKIQNTPPRHSLVRDPERRVSRLRDALCRWGF